MIYPTCYENSKGGDRIHQSQADTYHCNGPASIHPCERDSVGESREPEDFTTWVRKQCELHPQFLSLSTVLVLELFVLEFFRSIREGNFSPNVQILSQHVP